MGKHIKPETEKQKKVAEKLTKWKRNQRDKEALSVEASLNQKLELFRLTGQKQKLTPAERKLKDKRIAILQAQKQKMLRDNPLAKFCPHAKQLEVIECFRQGDLFIVIVSTGNGWGKTANVVNILGNIIWGAQPFAPTIGTQEEYCNINSPVNWLKEWGEPPETWYKGGWFDKWPYPKTLRIASDPAHIDDEGPVQEEIDRWWPRKRFKSEKGKYSYRSKIVTDTGWSVKILSYEMPEKEFEGKTLGIMWFDEPPPSRIWGSVISRMRRGGIIVISMTPLFQAAYLYDEVENSKDDSNIKIHFGDVEDNCAEHGHRGVLLHEDIEKMIKRYPPAEREARITGKFMALAGKVHPLFSSEIHIVPSRHTYDKIPTRDQILERKHLYQFIQVVDPHERKFDAVGYYAVDEFKRLFVIDEHPDHSLPPFHELRERKWDWKELIENILLPKERALGLTNNDIIRIMDPRFAKGKSQKGAGKTGLTVEEEWSFHYGAGFDTSVSDNMTACINKLDMILRLAPDGFPMLLMFEEFCRNHRYAMERWQWDEWTGKTGEKREIKGVPQEKNSDFPRLLHYLSMYDPVYDKKPLPQNKSWRDRINEARSKAGYSRRRSGTWMGR